MPKSRRLITCANCNRRAMYGAADMCHACYRRWRRRNQPRAADGTPIVPPPQHEGVYKPRASGRLEEFARLRVIYKLSVHEAARELGLCDDTGRRYERNRKLRRSA